MAYLMLFISPYIWSYIDVQKKHEISHSIAIRIAWEDVGNIYKDEICSGASEKFGEYRTCIIVVVFTSVMILLFVIVVSL